MKVSQMVYGKSLAHTAHSDGGDPTREGGEAKFDLQVVVHRQGQSSTNANHHSFGILQPVVGREYLPDKMS